MDSAVDFEPSFLTVFGSLVRPRFASFCTTSKCPPNGPQNAPQKGTCFQKPLALRLPTSQEKLPAKLAVDLPAGTACNNFLDGGRTLREAVTIIMIIIRPPSPEEIGKRRQ